MLRFNDTERRLTLSVHDVVDAGPNRGSLLSGVVQTSVSRMQAGQRAHTQYQSERAAQDSDFQAEVSVAVSLMVRGWEVRIRGRMDGLSKSPNGRLIVEELKSTGLDAAALANREAQDWPAYEAQVAVYRWLLHAMGHERPIGRLVLVSLVDGSQRSFLIDEPLEHTQVWIQDRLDWVLRQRERRLAWQQKRKESTVPFAHSELRAGQQEVVDSVLLALESKQKLLLSAPTGLGKTAAALHGVLQHAYQNNMRVFVATAKGTQQAIVEQTLRQLHKQGLPLRSVSIHAKEKACLMDVVDCRPDSCPYAAHYFDKLEPVLEGLLEKGVSEPLELKSQAKDGQVCPFELSLDFSDHADVVVGDYNYAFHPQVQLKRHFGDSSKEWILLVDEAHNLPERARGYWSPELKLKLALGSAAALSAEGLPDLAAFITLSADIASAIDEVRWQIDSSAWTQRGEAVCELSPRIWRDLRSRVDELALDYAMLRRSNPAPGDGDPYIDLARALIHFCQVLDEWVSMGEGPEIQALFKDRPCSVRLVCLDPAPWMRKRFEALGGAVLMSATLSPPQFYRDLLGLDEKSTQLAAHPSPFPPENRRVIVAPNIRTTYKDRANYAEKSAQMISQICEATPGNVAVYYSSFALMKGIADKVEVPGRDTLMQVPRMPEKERRDLVDRLRQFGAPRVLHAVLGGIFAEGIDLPGGILKTIVLVGPALPMVGLERDLMRNWYEERYGDGFGYAFLVPGMSKVVQAAGRVVRGPTERGCVVLMGKRFAWKDYSRFFPDYWSAIQSKDPAVEVKEFWDER